MELHAYLGTHRNFEGFPRKALCVLLENTTDADYSGPKGPAEVLERDEKGRISKRVSGFNTDISVRGDGSEIKYIFSSYEEWTYDDEQGTAVMRRGGSDEDDFTERTYRDGVMVQEISAKKYLDGGKAIVIHKPLVRKPGYDDVIYARLHYYGDRVDPRGLIYPSPIFYPSANVGIATHLGKGMPIGLEDRYVQTEYWEYKLAESSLKNSYRAFGINFSHGAYGYFGNDGVVELSGDNINITTEFGQVSFPAELDFNTVFKTLRFDNKRFF